MFLHLYLVASYHLLNFTQLRPLTSSGFELVTKRTRKRVYFDEMDLVVPWRELVGFIQPFAPTGTGAKVGRPTFALDQGAHPLLAAVARLV